MGGNHMKHILCAALITFLLATPALAAKLYLKDGGTIQAKRVWRSDNRVYVLATRDTMTSFELNEVNLKKTFTNKKQKQRKVVRRGKKTTPQRVVGIARTESAITQPHKTAEGRSAFKMPDLPSQSLPKRSPEDLLPSRGKKAESGTIRGRRDAMQDRLDE